MSHPSENSAIFFVLSQKHYLLVEIQGVLSMKRLSFQSPRTARCPNVLIGLSVATKATPGGFRPLESQNGEDLFGELRWQGWAVAINAGYVDRLIIIGGLDEHPEADCPEDIRISGRGPEGTVFVPRGYACCHSLIHKYGVSPRKVEWRLSAGESSGNATIISNIAKEQGEDVDVILSTSHYHLPRAIMDVSGAKAGISSYVPAEAFSVARHLYTGSGRQDIRSELLRTLGSNNLAGRIISEICSAADKLNMVHRPRTARA